MEENGALSPSMLVPLRLQAPPYHDSDSSIHRQLAVVAPNTSAITAISPPFKLPEGWAVEERPRSGSSQIDKYYYEPGTGQKFRSLKAVERYLTGVEYTPSRKAYLPGVEYPHCRKAFKLRNHVRSSGPRKSVISGGMLLRLDKEGTDQRQLAVVGPAIAAATSPFNLPDGWVVEEVPRMSKGYSDKYYYEPGTGRKFRSLISVERYLAEEADNAPLSQMFKLGCHVKNSARLKKIPTEKVKTSTSDSPEPPAKINWVLGDPGGHAWNPFVGESMVPEPVKQRWANRFMLALDDRQCAAPEFEW